MRTPAAKMNSPLNGQLGKGLHRWKIEIETNSR
jgi:hypothetical protein